MANKDIFDQLREQSEKLECPPTPQAWGRIERRIQSNRPAVKRARVRQLPRPLSIAAGLALVIGLSVVFLWLSEQSVAAPLAQNTESSFVLEESSLDIEAPATPQIALAHTHVTTTPKKPIVEGKPSQRLIAKHELPQERNTSRPQPTVDSMERRTGR